MQHDLRLSRGPLVLRPLSTDDAPGFLPLVDEVSWQGMARPVPRTVEEATADLASMIDNPTTQAWAVELDGALVGRTSLYDIVEGMRVEVGSTYYGRAVWGTVVNPLCKLLVLTHCFEERGFERVALRCDHRNTRSHDAILRLGATFEGTLRRFRRGADGSIVDVDYFSITPAEWPGVRRGLEERVAAFGV